MSPKVVTIRHRLTSDPDVTGSYVVDTTTLEVPVSGVFTQPFFITGLLNGTSYTVAIKSACGTVDFKQAFTTPCTCPAGFVSSADSSQCEKVETVPPTINQSNYCYAASQNGAYSTRFARIYNGGWSNSSIALVSAPISDVFAEMAFAPYWANPTLSPTLGIMNREGIWVDSDCNGVKDALNLGSQTTAAFTYNNSGLERIMYVGASADNQFIIKLNGTEVAKTTVVNSDNNYRVFHIFPVRVRVGANDFNIIGTGDQSVSDSIAMVVFDNTPEQIRDATSDAALTILFRTSSLRGTMIDVATCPAGYSLVTTGGKGTYTCRKITYADCEVIAP